MGFFRRPLATAALLLLFAGCARVMAPTGKSPLAPPQMSSDSVVVEIFSIRVPFGDAEVNGPLWQEIDEQQISPELRTRLNQNGFRVGLIGTQVPAKIAELLESTDPAATPGGLEQTGTQVNLEESSAPLRRHLQLRAGKRGVIQASELCAEMPLLLYRNGQVRGEPYYEAQAQFGLRTYPNRDGRVKVELVPEVEHGQSRREWVGGQGSLRLEVGKPKHVLDDMAVELTLSPGEMIALTSIPTRPGSVGHYFFTAGGADARMQKLLIVRLLQTQHEELLAPTDVLPLDDP